LCENRLGRGKLQGRTNLNLTQPAGVDSFL
jgi:hypothetical protein